jgi:hypothetical protein
MFQKGNSIKLAITETKPHVFWEITNIKNSLKMSRHFFDIQCLFGWLKGIRIGQSNLHQAVTNIVSRISI